MGCAQQALMHQGDIYGQSVRSLLHFERANGSTTFIDARGRTWTSTGNAQISTTSPLVGIGSLLLDGAGDYISTTGTTAFDYTASGGFCIEMAVFVDAIGAVQMLAGTRAGSTQNGWFFILNAAGTFALQAGNTVGGAFMTLTSTATISANTLTRITASYDGTTLRLFKDGALDVSTTTKTGTYASTTNSLVIGFDPSVNGPRYFKGKIDEFRLTTGAARYTAAYTPETYPLPNA